MIPNKEQKNDILRLMRECGKIMTAEHTVDENGENITSKSGTANFVTVFDVKVQNALIEGLKNIFPQARFLAEEKDNSQEDIKTGLVFIIDPIDGTTNFIHDMKASAISVALLSDAKPVFGAVYDPYREELFYAALGQGAFLNGERITVSERPLELALVSFGSSPYNRKTLGKSSFAAAERVFMNTADIRRSGSAAIDMAFVAAGRSDAFFELILSPWDYAAGYVLITEAGGKLTNNNGEAPDFGKPDSVVATNGKIHKQMLDLVNDTI